MKVIPEEARYARRCYFCHRSHIPENPVAFELDIEETRIPKEKQSFWGRSVYCCKECLQKEWIVV